MTLTVPVGTMYQWPYPTSGVIVVIADIEKAFQNAHFALLKKRCRPQQNLSMMKQWWWEEYEVTVIDDWFALEFNSEQEITMFLLRWS